MRTITALLMLTMAVTGCTAWWWASYNEIEATPDMVTYEYELANVNYESMNEAAQEHCAQYGKGAQVVHHERGGYNHTTTYRCILRPGAPGALPQL